MLPSQISNDFFKASYLHRISLLMYGVLREMLGENVGLTVYIPQKHFVEHVKWKENMYSILSFSLSPSQMEACGIPSRILGCPKPSSNHPFLAKSSIPSCVNFLKKSQGINQQSILFINYKEKAYTIGHYCINWHRIDGGDLAVSSQKGN